MPDDAMLTSEFFRRLKHQLEMYASHQRACEWTGGGMCRTGTLISRGLADSVTTLSGMGWQREANDMVRAVIGTGEAGQ